MRYSGVIFDFNGTLFWDTEMHIVAWREFSKRLRGTPFSDEEMLSHMIGKTNMDIISYAIGKKAAPEFANEVAEQKEEYYRQMCLNDRKCVRLAPGAEDFLNFLLKNNIPRNIATMSDKANVDFFVEVFNLKKWFDPAKIVHSDGIIRPKPAPDVFELAAKKIGLHPSTCIAFEDSVSGLESAKNAKIGKVFAIESFESRDFYSKVSAVDEIIKDFHSVDRSIFDYNLGISNNIISNIGIN